MTRQPVQSRTTVSARFRPAEPRARAAPAARLGSSHPTAAIRPSRATTAPRSTRPSTSCSSTSPPLKISSGEVGPAGPDDPGRTRLRSSPAEGREGVVGEIEVSPQLVQELGVLVDAGEDPLGPPPD